MGFITEYMLLTAIMTTMCLLIIGLKNKKAFADMRSAFSKHSIAVIICYALLFFSSELLSLLCSGMIPLVMQAPMAFCVPIITTAVIDYVVYKVKLTKLTVIQMVFAALCCIGFVLDK